MFELHKTPVKFHCLPRNEKHGLELVLAVTLTINMECDNAILDMLQPGLKDAFYYLGEVESGENEELEPTAKKLRFPLLKMPVTLELEGEGYHTTLHLGIDDDSDLVIVNCNIKKFQLTMKENGIVSVKFSINAESAASEISQMVCYMDKPVDLTLTAPEPTSFDDIV